MNDAPQITTIIPYFNPRFNFFVEAIESLLSQSYKKWECIIVNDGSSIESKNALEGYIHSLSDKRFSILHLDKNYGSSAARNIGIRNTKSEIVTFLDTDDIHFPWYYQEIINFFSKSPEYLILASPSYLHIKTKEEKSIFLGEFENKIINKPHGIVFHGFRFPKILSNEEKEVYDLLTKKIALKLFINTTPRLALKKEVFQRIGYDPQFLTSEDSDLCLQILNSEDLLNSTYITLNPYYLHRIFSSRTRLTQNSLLVFQNMARLKNKYNDKASIASKSLWLLGRRDEWQFNTIIYDHLNGQSLIKTIRDTMSTSKSKKGKIKNLWRVLKLIIKYQLITQILGIDYREHIIPKAGSTNKTKDIEELFIKHLQSIEQNRNKTYVNKTYEAIFN